MFYEINALKQLAPDDYASNPEDSDTRYPMVINLTAVTAVICFQQIANGYEWKRTDKLYSVAIDKQAYLIDKQEFEKLKAALLALNEKK